MLLLTTFHDFIHLLLSLIAFLIVWGAFLYKPEDDYKITAGQAKTEKIKKPKEPKKW